jgi:fatty acid desaturase
MIFRQWLSWHFKEMPKAFLEVWKNYLKFNWNYFSISILFRTFFSPWRKYQMSYEKGFNPSRFFETFFSNLIFRTLGAFIRSGLIIIGLVLEVLLLLAGAVFLVVWIFLPLILISGLIFGFRIIF